MLVSSSQVTDAPLHLALFLAIPTPLAPPGLLERKSQAGRPAWPEAQFAVKKGLIANLRGRSASP